MRRLGVRVPKVLKPKPYINKVLNVLDYQEEVKSKWKEWGMEGLVDGLGNEAKAMIDEGAVYGELGDKFQRKMDDVMRKMHSLMKKAEGGVVGQEKVESRVRSRKKEPFSEKLRSKSERLRELQRLLHREKTRGKLVARSYGKWVERRFGMTGLGTPSSLGAEHQWAVWRNKVKEQMLKARAELQVQQREEWRAMREKNRAWVKSVVKSGKWKQVFNKIRGKEFVGIDRDILVVIREDERVMVTEHEEIGS